MKKYLREPESQRTGESARGNKSPNPKLLMARRLLVQRKGFEGAVDDD